jgi:chemotaxis response regulator CheB
MLLPEGYAHNGDDVQRDAVRLPDSESGRWFNSAFVSFFSGLQTLIVKSRLLTAENSVQIRGARLKFPVASVSPSFPVIAMAAAVGDLKALAIILGGLPSDLPAAIVIVIHVTPDHKSVLAEILKCRTHLQVTEAHTGDVLVPSKVFVAPPNRHLFVVKGGRPKLSSSNAEKIHFACQSAEPLLASVAEVNGKNAIAVLLTGGDGDGSFGVQIIKDNGGTVIAQDRPTSENFSTPETSIKSGDVDYILPLDKIAPC